MGAKMSNFVDLTGLRFGRLVVEKGLTRKATQGFCGFANATAEVFLSLIL